MKLLRIKISDSNGFRGLPKHFEYHFRNTAMIDNNRLDFAPFICAGPNGSGKSNLLEALAAIFFHLDCKNLSYLPELFRYDPEKIPKGYQQNKSIPNAFELEYLGKPFPSFRSTGEFDLPHIKIIKKHNKAPLFYLLNADGYESDLALDNIQIKELELLPDYVVAYSSGENEILSLPFFKRRFIQFDWYLDSVRNHIPNNEVFNNRLVYLDQEFNQAILLCNFIFENDKTTKALNLLRDEIEIENISYFRIIIRDILYPSGNPSTTMYSPEEQWPILENIRHQQEKFLCCATAHFYDFETDNHYYDFWLDDNTKHLFKLYFGTALDLFQVFQLFLTLNLYSVINDHKMELYQSNSLFVNETIPRLPSDQRVMRFKDVVLTKKGVSSEKLYTKALSDGENQLLHTLGLCILYRDNNVLFLLDEPETHFNPQWRAKYISLIRDCLNDENEMINVIDSHEMLITTHTPFLISDSKPEQVLVFNKYGDKVNIKTPNYNTLGASINKITFETFGKKETIGNYAKNQYLTYYEEKAKQPNMNFEQLIQEIHTTLGDSIEKVLLIQSILDKKRGNS